MAADKRRAPLVSLSVEVAVTAEVHHDWVARDGSRWAIVTSTVTFPQMNGLGRMRHAFLVETEPRP